MAHIHSSLGIVRVCSMSGDVDEDYVSDALGEPLGFSLFRTQGSFNVNLRGGVKKTWPKERGRTKDGGWGDYRETKTKISEPTK